MKIFKINKLNKFKLKNRILAMPMCQYSSENGNPTTWHYEHLARIISTGVSLLILESTAVSNNGRITLRDLKLINKNQIKKFKDLILHLKKINNIPIGIQISHSGRKGSSEIPWIKKNTPLKKNKWQTYAPSKIRKDKKWPLPKVLSIKQIELIKDQFFKSTKLANKSNFDLLEIHMAHGYLLHQFFSPISNKRKDNYGGNIKKRMKLLIDISKGVRNIWPKNKILGARICGNDFLKNGLKIKDSICLIKHLEKIGFDYVSISNGGIRTKTNLKLRDRFNLQTAKKIKQNSTIKICVAGKMDNLKKANQAIVKNECDYIGLARSLIEDSSKILREEFKNNLNLKKQYLRCFKKF